MNTVPPMQPSTFAQLVDKLRSMSDEELKLLYIRFFSSELTDEWKDITSEADFKDATEADIVKAIQKNRYRN